MTRRERSWEFAAIPLTILLLGILGLLMWAFTKGLWVWVAVGVVALVGAVVAAIAVMARPRRASAPDEPSLPAGAAPHVDDGVHRILVIADDDCAPTNLSAAVAEHGGGRVEAFVVAPALASRTARWTGDEHAYEDAAKHLEATLAALAQLGIDASGHVGSHDPLQATEDGLREFPANEIVFAVHASGQVNWLEDGVVEAARARYPLPVNELAVGGSAS